MDTFLKQYESDKNFSRLISSKDYQYLLNFCNALRLATSILYAKGNRGRLIAACARLEGSGRTDYQFGGKFEKSGGLQIKLRKSIWLKETGVNPESTTGSQSLLANTINNSADITEQESM